MVLGLEGTKDKAAALLEGSFPLLVLRLHSASLSDEDVRRGMEDLVAIQYVPIDQLQQQTPAAGLVSRSQGRAGERRG